MAVEETNLRAVVTLRDQMTPVLKSLEKEMRVASRDMRDGFESVADAAKVAGAGIAAVAGAGAGVWFATTAAAETAVQMDMMSRQTGVATERLQAWQAVAVASGMEGEEFAEALRDMNIELSDAATGGKDELAQLLQKVGISARDASGNIKTADQVFLDFADAVARQTDSAIQLRMAISAFGEDTGAKLLPMLQKGSKAFRESEAAMKAAGSAITQDQIDSLKDFRTEWESVKLSFSTASTSMLSTLAPALSTIAEGLQTVIDRVRPLLQEKADEWAQNLATALQNIPWDTIAEKIAALVEGGDKLREEFGVVGSAVAFAFEHIGEAIGLYVTGKTVKGVFDLYQGITTLGSGIGTLLKAAGPLVGAASPFVIWGTIIAGLATAVYQNWDSIVEYTSKFVKGMEVAINGLLGWLKAPIETVKGFAEDVGEAISSAIDTITPDFLKEKSPEVDLLQKVQIEGDGAAAQTISYPPPNPAPMPNPVPRPNSVPEPETGTAGFWSTSMTQADAAAMSTAQPAQEHRYSGSVVVDFRNAPQTMQLSGARGDGGLDVSTNIDYSKTGVGPYAFQYDSL